MTSERTEGVQLSNEQKVRSKAMKVYLYPDYVGLHNARVLTEFLEQRGVSIEVARWNGTLESLPTDEPAFIRASSQMKIEWGELAQFCKQHGHLCFYDGFVVGHDGPYGDPDCDEGQLDGYGLRVAIAKFLGINPPQPSSTIVCCPHCHTRFDWKK